MTGAVVQLKECCQCLMRLAKGFGVTVFAIGKGQRGRCSAQASEPLTYTAQHATGGESWRGRFTTQRRSLVRRRRGDWERGLGSAGGAHGAAGACGRRGDCAGHVTKASSLAGPKVLEHMVDAVLALEGDPTQSYR